MNTQASSVLLFALASAISTALLIVRIAATGHLHFLYLPWNLLLAWVPFGFALLARRVADTHPPRRWSLGLCGAAWLLFFPNAPYIFTDLIHLVHRHPALHAPLWFDLLLNLLVAMTGFFLGFASLAVMQGLVSRRAGAVLGWLFVVVSLALSGFGVYLGRYLRWNSWDVLLAPIPLLTDIGEQLTHPWAHPRAYGFSFLCFLFLLLSYLMCFSLPRLHVAQETERLRERWLAPDRSRAESSEA